MGRKFHTARQQPGLETELERIKIRLAEVEKALWIFVRIFTERKNKHFIK